MVKLEHLTNKVVEVAREVGSYIAQERVLFDSSMIEQKGKNDLVSYVDKAAEQKIVLALKELLPEAGFLTEEKTIVQSHAEYQWIIDPLDGTTNFIHGIPTYSVSIALARNNELLIGVVYEVNQKECFYAWKGGGAFLNKKTIQVSKAQDVSEGLFLTGLPIQAFEKKEAYLSIISELMEQSHGIRRIGSAAVDLAYVACGRSEGYFECNLNPWDVAAGALIVQEAGGKVTDFSGGDNYVFGREIMASCAVHTELLKIIQKFWH